MFEKRERHEEKINWNSFIYNFVFVTMILSVIFLVIRITMAPAEAVAEDVRVKSDYLLMLVQCILGVVAMRLPDFIEHKIQIHIPSNMLLLYAVFLYCAIYLGEVRAFYYNVPHWDTILHTFSGGMLGALGFSFVTILNKSEKIPMNLSPVFVAVFAFCFAVTLGVFWETMNLPLTASASELCRSSCWKTGTQLIGRAALLDTMKDLIVDCLGAFIMSFVGYLSLRYKTGFMKSCS